MSILTTFENEISIVSAKLREAEIKNLPNREELKMRWIALVAEADRLRPEEDEKKWNRMYPTLWWARP